MVPEPEIQSAGIQTTTYGLTQMPPAVIATIHDEIDASFVPFKVDIVTTPLHQSLFSEIVQSEAKRWM